MKDPVTNRVLADLTSRSKTVRLETMASSGAGRKGALSSWSGGPVNVFSLWKPEAVRITSGAGLPKLKDFPAEFGGSGEAIAE